MHRIIDLVLDEHVSVQPTADRFWDYEFLRERMLHSDIRGQEES
jgi:hypothetical protein